MIARVFSVLLASASSVSAGALSGNDLLRECALPGDAAYGFCTGYIIGAWEGLVVGAASVYYASDLNAHTAQGAKLVVTAGLRSCPPNEVIGQQIKDITLAHLAAHPETRHEPAASLIVDAMSAAFPCE